MNRRPGPLIAGLLMIAAGLAGIVGLRPILMSRGTGGMMNRGGMGGMMGHGGMKPMMQAMMGNMLPLGIDPAALPMPRSAGAQSLQHFCTQCHDLPAPGLCQVPRDPIEQRIWRFCRRT